MPSGSKEDSVIENFVANRDEVLDEQSSDLVNSDIFISNLKLALNTLPDGDIDLSDLGNEIGRVIASLNSPCEPHLYAVLSGIKHGFDLVRKTGDIRKVKLDK